eukprot:COSAG05_NODE_2114_length_3542_cov_543.877432_1_plen_60_part_10
MPTTKYNVLYGKQYFSPSRAVRVRQVEATESSGDGKRRQHGVEGEGGEAAMDSRQAMQRA